MIWLGQASIVPSPVPALCQIVSMALTITPFGSNVLRFHLSFVRASCRGPSESLVNEPWQPSGDPPAWKSWEARRKWCNGAWGNVCLLPGGTAKTGLPWGETDELEPPLLFIPPSLCNQRSQSSPLVFKLMCSGSAGASPRPRVLAADEARMEGGSTLPGRPRNSMACQALTSSRLWASLTRWVDEICHRTRNQGFAWGWWRPVSWHTMCSLAHKRALAGCFMHAGAQCTSPWECSGLKERGDGGQD